ncbi:MAG: hypothetical protein V3S51_02040 [Dehalococcoidia bacterium]
METLTLEQSRALQRNNTELVMKVRELEKQLAETTEWLAAQVRISKKYWEALDEVRTKARAALEGE